MKTNIKRYIVFFMFLILLVFSINLISNNNIYAASGGSASFGDSNSSSNQTDNQQKTGNNVNDVKNLGEGTLNSTSGTIAEIENQGGTGTEAGTPDHNERYGKFNTALYKIWGVIFVVLQVASMSGIIFAGVRYMFASVDSKADMKKSMIYLVIGMVIVFAASSVVGFVTGTFNEIFPT